MHRKRTEIYSTEPRRDVDMRTFFEQGTRMVCEGARDFGRDFMGKPVASSFPTSPLLRSSAGLVNTSDMITHVYPLSRVQEAFDLRNDKSPACEAIHVLIDCQTASDEIVRFDRAVGAAAASHDASPVVARAPAPACC